jgi:hypothetical protein
MTKYPVCAGLVACAVLWGCAPGIMINPDYKSKPMSGKHLHVEMVGQTTIDYTGNMDNEFSKEGRYGKIRTLICSTAVVTLRGSSTFGSVDKDPGDCKSYYSRKLKWDEDSGEFIVKLPNDSCYSSSDSQSIYLFIEQTSVTSHPYVQLLMVDFIPVGAIPHKPLTIAGEFVYWDVAAKKPIAWGKASGTYESGAGVIMETWLSAACNFSLRMVKDSPFDPAYGRKR